MLDTFFLDINVIELGMAAFDEQRALYERICSGMIALASHLDINVL